METDVAEPSIILCLKTSAIKKFGREDCAIQDHTSNIHDKDVNTL